MKKIIAIIITVLSVMLMFTSCTDKTKTDKTTTEKAETTTEMFNKENAVPESTDSDSALADGVKDAADDAEKVDEDIKQDVEDAKNDIKEDVKN